MMSRRSTARESWQRSKSSSSVALIVVGLFGGFLLGTMFDKLGRNHDYSSLLSLKTSSIDFNKPLDDTGWGTIHVFYGQASALMAGNPNQQWFSQVKQDEIILDLLANDGADTHKLTDTSLFFIDLAANDAKEFSKTLALEHRGWNGLCIEPNAAYWYRLSHRKCTTIGALVGDDIAATKVKFRGVYGGIVGKMDEKLANRKHEPESQLETRYTIPFATLLSKFNVPKTIDYLSLDVEGAEYMVMHSFPFDHYTIRLLTIERPSQELKSLLEGHGYLFLKDLVWWGETLWAHQSTGLSPSQPKVVKIKTEERGR